MEETEPISKVAFDAYLGTLKGVRSPTRNPAMPDRGPRLILVLRDGSIPGTARGGDSTFTETIIVPSMAEARRATDPVRGDLVVCPATRADAAPGTEGSVVMGSDGTVHWQDHWIEKLSKPALSAAVARCQEVLSSSPIGGVSEIEAHGQTLRVEVRPMQVTPDGEVHGFCIIRDMTAQRLLESRLRQVHKAGKDLVHFDEGEIGAMNVAERLAALEKDIVLAVHEILDFDNFEIRLLDQKTNQLELVISANLSPLTIGELIRAEPTGHGISGWVAATGQPYMCPDVRKDRLYREGLDNAASSLTVPLLHHDNVIGVFNVESYTADVFDELDLRLAQTYAAYIAHAMHMLDLLVVERYTTSEKVSQTVMNELSTPLDTISETALALDKMGLSSDQKTLLDSIASAAKGLRNRVAVCTSGPQTLLDAESEISRLQVHDHLAGRHVLVADDETQLRLDLTTVLEQIGMIVTSCSNGLEAIDAMTLRKDEDETFFEIIVSDIRMPDRNGYEVFSAAKGHNELIPVILMTGFGYDPNHSIVRASQEGMAAVLFKPFKAAMLIEAIENALSVTES